jgi:eukaryotic-like serine/threonine-protein kinase
MADSIGRYEVLNKLGAGGMAEVYLGRDPFMQRQVAIKVMSPALAADPEVHRRFEREAVVIAALEHSYIVPVYDFGYMGQQPYLVMRYMSGGSLKEHIEDYGALPLATAVGIIERMASALDEAHSRGIVHRDLKPDNMLLDHQGGTYLSDFGLVKILIGNTTGTKGNFFAGTPAYMAPEQVHGRFPIDGRTDVYALGMSLFEMLTGQQPYADNNPMKLMMKQVNEPVPSLAAFNPSLDSRLDAVLQRALAKTPEGRYESVLAFTDALRAVA